MSRAIPSTLAGAAALAALLASCGPQPPNTQGSKPKPVYAVPKEQLAAEADEANGGDGQAAKKKLVQAQTATTTNAGVSVNKTMGSAKEFNSDSKVSVKVDASGVKMSEKSTLKAQSTATLQGPSSSSLSSTATSTPATGQSSTPTPASTTPASTNSSAGNDSSRGAFTGTADPGTISSVLSYGTGETSLKVKKNVESKLKNINANHNSDLENALKEQ